MVIEERATSGTSWNYWTNKAWGVNLGNWLILERWMGGQAFEAAGSNGQDEWTLSKSTSNAAAILKQHWDSWVTEDDFRKLARAKVNHVRIPVGFWAFITPDAGEPYVHQGQKAQIERILDYCSTYQMYALIDLHGLPGSQNGEAHSGHNSGRIEFFTKHNIDRSLRTVQAVVDWVNHLDERRKSRIAGIEVANEPKPNNEDQEATLKNYYRQAYKIITASTFRLPMIFHDAFRGPAYWKGFFPSSANAVLDLHPYWAFPPANDKTAILSQICDKKPNHESFSLPVLYGEWSLASGVSRSDEWMRQFLDTQVSVYKSGNAAGAVFWSLKNTINSDAWSFEQLMDENIINAATFEHHPKARC
ncbi:glycoside hydrolase superfamily [Absidia repens]|uniref:glucan 1,3-beta-glucosidase n=1 Tax=Absidia repens TaxID=90262 RepID=A0A1X2J224_9FUNG|nr:glycoside hydrolase superfamily [Absidia repens]